MFYKIFVCLFLIYISYKIRFLGDLEVRNIFYYRAYCVGFWLFIQCHAKDPANVLRWNNFVVKDERCQRVIGCGFFLIYFLFCIFSKEANIFGNALQHTVSNTIQLFSFCLNARFLHTITRIHASCAEASSSRCGASLCLSFQNLKTLSCWCSTLLDRKGLMGWVCLSVCHASTAALGKPYV